MALQGSYSSGEYKIYQTRTNKNDNWRKHYAGGWKCIATSFGNINFEFKITTSLQDKNSSLSIYFYPADKTDRRKFMEHMQQWYAVQDYGFMYWEERCGYLLNNKTVHADARDEIFQYFSSSVPSIVEGVEKALLL